MTEPQEKDLEFLLCQYLDGQLGRRERLELEQRLKSDESLGEELRRYVALDGYLVDLGQEEIDGVDYALQREEIVAAVERQALLPPARRRPLLLRPVFATLVAAASILVVVSAAMFLFAPDQPPESVVSMKILPAAPAPTGAAVVSVKMSRPSFDALPWTPRPTAASLVPAAPAGTVVVSIAPHVHRPTRSADSMVIY
jgi:hypothetical protein